MFELSGHEYGTRRPPPSGALKQSGNGHKAQAYLRSEERPPGRATAPNSDLTGPSSSAPRRRRQVDLSLSLSLALSLSLILLRQLSYLRSTAYWAVSEHSEVARVWANAEMGMPSMLRIYDNTSANGFSSLVSTCTSYPPSSP